MAIYDELVHSPGSQGGADGTYHHFTGIDITDDLCLALGGVSSFLQQDNGCSLQDKGGFVSKI